MTPVESTVAPEVSGQPVVLPSRATTSASNIARRKACPGSHHAEDGLPEPDDSEESAEGTMLHAMSADPLIERENCLPEQTRILERCEYLRDDVLYQIVGIENLDEYAYDHGNERALWVHKGIRPYIPGHCDYWRYYPAAEVLIIVDKKFGRREVPGAEINYQLRTYAVQGAQEWPCKRVYVAIVQPRLYGDAATSVAVYDPPAIAAARTEILGIRDACEAPDAPRYASDDACRYCKAKLDCPQYIERMMIVEAHRSVPIVQLSDEQLGEVLDACKFADLIQDQAKAEARRRLREGGMSGFTLKPNSARRAITDGSLPFTLLHEAGFTHEELFSVASLSVSGATKLYTRKKRTAKEAAQALALVLGGCIRINEVEPSIVRL
jgi:hypothetical protein